MPCYPITIDPNFGRQLLEHIGMAYIVIKVLNIADTQL